MKNYTSRNTKWICLILLFFNCLAMSICLNIDTFFYDSNFYWTVADPVYKEGTFNLLLFPETFRGCLLPLALLILKKIFRGIWGWRILSAIMVTLVFGQFLPRLFEFSILSIPDISRVILSEILFFVIWADFLQYPLSDLPAAFFLIAGAYFSSRLWEHVSIAPIRLKSGIGIMAYGVGIGGCLYFSYNCRAAFLYGAVLIFLAVIVKHIKKKMVKQATCTLIGITLGIFMVAWPQCMINMKYVGVFSPKVYTETYSNYETNLQATQVLWGLSWTRYETFAGNLEEYESASVFFDDRIGNRIINEENITPENFRLVKLLKLFLKYPLDMIGIYTRHFISLITPAWSQIYITHIFTNKTFVLVLSMSVWLLFGIKVFQSIEMKETPVNAEYVVPICIPAFLQMFGAPELRFFLPVYLLLYTYVCWKISISEIISFVRGRWLQIILLLIVISALWITAFGDILGMNREVPFLISDRIH